MQQSVASTPTISQSASATTSFSNASWGSSALNGGSSNGTRSRPSTSSGEQRGRQPNALTKDRDRERKPSLNRKSSFTSPARGKRRVSSSSNGVSGQVVVTDASAPPALPDFAVAVAALKPNNKETEASNNSPPNSGDSYTRMMNRTAPAPIPTNGIYTASATSPPLVQSALQLPPTTETSTLHQHIQEMTNKRISTLDYLRKAHEGRVYWFNTLLFDKPDLQKMPYFDSRKLARRATNYLLLGLSLPAVIDLNSSTALEFLRSLNTLLSEFDSYQQIHTENGVNSSSLSRARLPQMFRRVPGGKGRRQSGAVPSDYAVDGFADGSALNSAPVGVISFGLGGEGNDLLPGEEYTHLLTPNLPFDPDFFETFTTLCDVLIDCYTKLLGLLSSPKECTPMVAELFTKADVRVRKIIIQGIVKEFEDSSRSGLKQEVNNVGKVVLGGLL